MCGRYTLRTRLNQLLQLFAAEGDADWEPRYNIAPTQSVAAVRKLPGSKQRQLVLLRWGLIPGWADSPAVGSSMINARAETLADKPAFRQALTQRRCVVLADGFYEWRKDGKAKQPHYIRLKDDRPFAFAGLWETWTKGNEPIESCTIVTTTPNEVMTDLHDRMPAILPEPAMRLWLDPTVTEPAPLLRLLRPYPADEMEAHPVSARVNSPRHDSSDLITSVEAPRVSERTFDWGDES